AGEQMTKLSCCILISLLDDDKDKHKYAQIYNLVRADGIGDWAKAIDEVLIGPTSHYLIPSSQSIRRELTQKNHKETWQYECVNLLNESLKFVDEEIESIPNVITLKTWFALFTRLRNKTRGHGAPST